MTEEQRKELAEETAKDIFEDAFKDLPYLKQRINMLIDAVVIGARNEGIEKVWKFFDEGSDTTLWRSYEITDAIEDLKEQEE